MLFWCVVYAIAVNRILTTYYLAGSKEIVPYGKDFSFLRMVCCVIIVEVLFIITKKIKGKNPLLNNVKDFLFVLFCVPAVLSYALFNYTYSLEFTIYSIIYWLFFSLFCGKISFHVKPLSKLKIDVRLEIFLIFLISSLLIIYIIKEVGGINVSVSLINVYSIRAMFKSKGSLLLTIIKASLGCYIVPFMTVECLCEKKRLFAVGFVLLQVLLYSMAKDKIYLLLIGIAVFLGLFGKSVVLNFQKWMSLALVGLSSINILAIFGVFYNLIFNIFTRRFFLMPVWLQNIYYEFFYDKPKIWFFQDTFFIDKLFTPIYNRSLTKIISEDFFNGAIENPNCGMVGEAFTRCGYLGVIIHPFLLVFIVNVLYIFFNGVKKETLLMFAISFCIVISNDVISSTSFIGTITIVCLFACCFRKTHCREEKWINGR
ncbi:MAG: hypothetical protein Q4E61_02515 [Alphaproteobacteria bacterium]|nr:hypothetical protein [Alphaproteobacteria bacterium]